MHSSSQNDKINHKIGIEFMNKNKISQIKRVFLPKEIIYNGKTALSRYTVLL